MLTLVLNRYHNLDLIRRDIYLLLHGILQKEVVWNWSLDDDDLHTLLYK